MLGDGPAPRLKGSRSRLRHDLTGALNNDLREHGTKLIAWLRKEKPAEYFKLILSLLPPRPKRTARPSTTSATMSCARSSRPPGQGCAAKLRGRPARRCCSPRRSGFAQACGFARRAAPAKVCDGLIDRHSAGLSLVTNPKPRSLDRRQ